MAKHSSWERSQLIMYHLLIYFAVRYSLESTKVERSPSVLIAVASCQLNLYHWTLEVLQSAVEY